MIRDIQPRAVWEMMEADPTAQLIDVRTPAEWHFVGLPDLSVLGRNIHTISWQLPGGLINERFIEELRLVGLDGSQPLHFICRSGARSRSAAMMALQSGFETVFNVADGFEGPLNGEGHRGSVAGWKKDNLPWRQS
ncbi:sulfide dehydrogenase [Acetobacter estunensis NRIC 0472]|uniref:Rhodanese-like domain-containing protein n=1 Tax=Acetobacter estunensis TaxID=104097 RepID=A0A967B3Q2_9PROT|nr:rhodanese-like domain-containing protein [Acetobacter estunensis]MBV1836351.1 rhodanese-like domain-containing protein [Acetobacter estunensis]NHO52664.1 rhodanese-like domain-containing protein [Acetobacter estunensis]GBQ22842.1 sulfide dehydrogenase [Acetobacter estunensis NRIC 0472]